MRALILGIESSCDESCAAVVEDGRQLLSHAMASSALIHRQYGGVVPEIASREHLLSMMPVVDEAMKQAKVGPEELMGIAVTDRPGLLGSLLVGVSVAKALAFAWKKALLPIHHLAGHIAANYLEHQDLQPPFLALVVSGAHSHVVFVQDYCRFEVLAQTRDDAPGEAFDKLARKMGLSYPGGPEIDRLAQKGQKQGIVLPRSRFQDSDDFSFSGLKTAALNLLQQAKQKAEREGVAPEEILSHANLAAAFQDAVVEVLLERAEKLIKERKAKALVLAGGVAANSALRAGATALCERLALPLYAPRLSLCTDNAAMIAAQGYYAFHANQRADGSLNPRAVASLESVEKHP